MKKTQDLEFNNGCLGGYYCPSTSQGLTSQFELLGGPWYWNYGVEHATAYKGPGSFVGTQVFESSTRRRPIFNDCSNYKCVGFNFPFCLVGEHYRVPSRTVVMYAYMYSLGTYTVPTITAPDWSLCEGARRRAWWSMQPRFEGEVQALNFLFELKDFKDLARHLGNFNFRHASIELNKLKSWLKRTFFINGRAPIGYFKDLVSYSTLTLAQLHLIKAFAIDPTVSDVLSIIAQAGTVVDDVQKEFFDRGQSAQRSHFGEEISSSDTVVPGTLNNYWHGSGTRSSLSFNATLEYTYDYRMRSRNDALKAYYGLNVNAEVVWNMLPFSFVADYFISVGKALHAMRTDPNVTLMPIQYCESLLKTESSGQYFTGDSRILFVYLPDNDIPEDTLGQYQGYRATHFQRRVTAPNKGAALPRIKLPSTRQVKNLVALARCLW